MEDAIKNWLEKLTDQEIIEIWLASSHPENPTPEESAALELMKERNIDF
ncbi:hypothetical protein [Parasphingorhabdus sp.]